MPEPIVHDPSSTASVERAVGSSSPDDPAPASSAGLAEALHEVSNALTVVIGWIERARAESSSPAAVERALDVASGRAAQARIIVRRAIGAEVPESAPRSAAAVLSEAVVGLEPEARRAGLDLEVIVAPDVEPLLLDEASHVVQILTNLLLNAVALSPRGATVSVDARPFSRGHGVVFGVSDEGPGVPRHRRATLFTSGVSTRKGGAGLGLRHAAGLARSAGGELSLAETLAGARFELRWPAKIDAPSRRSSPDFEQSIAEKTNHLEAVLAELALPPRRALAPSTARARDALQGARILVVEDDDAVIDLLDTALSARGADVVSVRRRGDLGAALAGGRFDAALLDISPIQDDVPGALATVRHASGDLRVVLISGSAAHLPDVPTGWVSAWVRKPFEISEILAALAVKA
ncbi:MAG: ATP-binding protein [Byssovorax sp.]